MTKKSWTPISIMSFIEKYLYELKGYPKDDFSKDEIGYALRDKFPAYFIERDEVARGMSDQRRRFHELRLKHKKANETIEELKNSIKSIKSRVKKKEKKMQEAQTKDVQQMTTEALARFSGSVLEVWKSPAAIRKIFCPDLTDEEFKFFMGMGLALQANPFKKEIYPVKYGGKPVSVIVARALYKRRAQEQPDYGGCVVEAVYPGEEFKPNPFDPLNTIHIIDTEKRYGKDGQVPYGAYFIGVYKEGKIPLYHFVAIKEYFKWVRDKQSGQMRLTDFWDKSPESMIKKVADSQGHRLMYEGIFSGTVTKDEVAANADKFEDAEAGGDGVDVMSSLDETIKGRTPVTQSEKKPTENNSEKGEMQNSQSQPSPDPTDEMIAAAAAKAKADVAAEKDASIANEEIEATANKHFEENPDAGMPEPELPLNQEREDGHNWPKWEGTPREGVLRKFRYLKNEKWKEHEPAMKEQNIFNTMQLAMKLFDATDFTPAEISPEQYEVALKFINTDGKDEQDN